MKSFQERGALWLRLLTFRSLPEDWQSYDKTLLGAGLLAVWLAGMGRYWDDPRANLLQHLGVGSVVYVFVLAFLLWVIIKPLLPSRFTYLHLLTFITLTSPPALLYAIPIEMWVPLETSNSINLLFLGIVALWRVALYAYYLGSYGEMGWFRNLICVATPLAVILLTLTILNLHHVIVNIMGGIRDADRSSQDAAYMLMFVASYLSIPVSVIAGSIWLGLLGASCWDQPLISKIRQKKSRAGR